MLARPRGCKSGILECCVKFQRVGAVSWFHMDAAKYNSAPVLCSVASVYIAEHNSKSKNGNLEYEICRAAVFIF